MRLRRVLAGTVLILVLTAPAAMAGSGGPGDDVLRGTSGQDDLRGGPGNDVIHSGGGADSVWGGGGFDTCYVDRKDAVSGCEVIK